jgi:hypothetical protein
MKNIKALVALLIVVIFCSFAADWVDFTSKEGRFKIKFPRQPVPSTQTVNSKPPLKMHLFLYDAAKYKDENLTYYVMYCDYSSSEVNSDFREELVDTILKGALNGGAESMGGKLISLTKNDYQEFPGRSAKYSVLDGQGYCYMNVYLVHSRMYLLLAMCDPKNDNNASLTKFFNSFTVTGLKK